VITLQSLTGRRSSPSLDVTSPLAISILAAFSRHYAYCVRTSPRLAVRRDRLFEPAEVDGSLSDQWSYSRFRRMRHCCAQRPRFRGFIPLPVRATLGGFLHRKEPRLSWGWPPWGIPLPCLGLVATDAPRRCMVTRGPPRSLSAPGHGDRIATLRGTEGVLPLLGCSLCY
jgi:hypothetical protein